MKPAPAVAGEMIRSWLRGTQALAFAAKPGIISFFRGQAMGDGAEGCGTVVSTVVVGAAIRETLHRAMTGAFTTSSDRMAG